MSEAVISENVHSAGNTTKVLPIFEFNLKDLSWVFIYKDGESETPVLFRFSHSLSNLSRHLIEQNLEGKFSVALYMKDEKSGEWEKDPFNNIKLLIPDIYPEYDPHQIMDQKMTTTLYRVMMREAHGAWLQKLADMWQMDVAKKSSAFDFNIKVNRE